MNRTHIRTHPTTNFILLMWIVLGASFLLAGCQTNKRIAVAPVQGRGIAPSDLQRELLMVEPDIRIESMTEETALDGGEKFHKRELSRQMYEAARSQLLNAGFLQVNELATSTNEPAAPFMQPATTRRLASGFVSEQARRFLAEHAMSQALFFVQSLQVKVGPGGFWDPGSGAIASGISTSVFRAAIIDPTNGAALWQGTVQLRSIAKPGSEALEKTLQQLYSTLNRKPNQ